MNKIHKEDIILLYELAQTKVGSINWAYEWHQNNFEDGWYRHTPYSSIGDYIIYAANGWPQ